MSIQTQAFNSPIQHVGIVRSYTRKSEIVHEDDPANYVYEVISGTVCTCRTRTSGKRRKTQRRCPSDHQR
jgi:CRP-like cAMP-binding protein